MAQAKEPLPVVILAGGLATRLRPLTETVPKALVEVAGRPFLYHQLDLLKKHGIRHVILLVGYLGEKIQQEFGDGSQIGMSLSYSFDGPALLGTAGAIRRALGSLPERFFVLYGDSYLPCDYRDIQNSFIESGRPALMTVYRNNGFFDTSNVEFDGKNIVRYDKRNRTPRMSYIDYGLGLFQRDVFAGLRESEAKDLAVVYQELLASGQLAAYEVQERFYEIGSPEGLSATEDFIRTVSPL
jgi:MurNAc alpha-1-phosphate uridylyltransferase